MKAPGAATAQASASSLSGVADREMWPTLTEVQGSVKV